MEIVETSIQDVFIIKLDSHEDNRGTFTRLFCTRELEQLGLNFKTVQTNVCYNTEYNTFRGLHYQVGGMEERKLVSCIQGAILDVVIDLRPNSPTRYNHLLVPLNGNRAEVLHVPRNFAHGYLTQTDTAIVIYNVDNFYNRGKERGIRWNDPFFNMKLPTVSPILSGKDAGYPDFEVKK